MNLDLRNSVGNAHIKHAFIALRKKKEMLAKIGTSVFVFLAILLSIGCSGDGTFESPDVFEVTTLKAVHGQIGHRADVMVAKKGEEIARQFVLVLQDSDVSTTPMYVVIGYTSGAPYSSNRNTLDAVELIDYLHAAVSVGLVPSLPEGTKQKGGITYGGNTLLCYLRVTTPSDTLYWSVRASQEKINEVLEQIAKPPKVLDTIPATVTEISYYNDSNLTMPLIDEVVLGDTVYTKVVFSKDVPIVFADDGPSEPSISSSVGQKELRYHMRPWGTALQSGDAQPYQNTKNTFICKYEVQTNDFGGMFRTYLSNRATVGTALHVTLFRYTGEIPTNTPETITDWQPQDFVGQVYAIPSPSWEKKLVRLNAVPIPGVTMTIASGPRADESTITDKNGRYRFLNVAEDALHLRTEKNHFEPKEAIVHRTHPTSLPDGSVPNFNLDPQKTPGNILIGQVWPEEVRPLLKEVLLVHDLLYIQGEPHQGDTHFSGYYVNGVIAIFSNTRTQDPIAFLKTLEHEIAHAHQHAVVSVNGSGGSNYWPKTPEGTAYAEAKQKDLDLGEKMYYDLAAFFYSSRLKENAAEHCANYWGEKRGAKLLYWHPHQRGKTLEELAPNRFKWAEEWLTKK